MSWLADRLGLHVNLRPFAAPAGAILGGMIGGPLGAGLGAGLFKTSDNLAHHDSLGHALGQGALNGALAYGTAGLFHGGGMPGGGSAAGQVAADTEPGLGSAIPNSAYGMSDTGQNVMRRVLGSTGSFIKDNRSALETVGQGANGVLNAVGQNKQLGIDQQRANAEAAQIQAAIDKQKAVAAAFQQLYGRPLPTQGTPALPAPPGSPVRNQVMNRVTGFAPQGAPNFARSSDGNGLTDDPTDPTNPNQPTQTAPPAPKPPTPPNPLGMAGIPGSPYAGNDSLYGSPYGYGYANVGRYFGGY